MASSALIKPKLLTVLEPRAYHDTADSCLQGIDWITIELESDWVNKALACDGRRGFIHVIYGCSISNNTKLVCIHESVGSQVLQPGPLNDWGCKLQLLLVKHFEWSFEVAYEPWTRHRESMLQQDGWCSYVGRWDCFFGGPDLGLDLGYVEWFQGRHQAEILLGMMSTI